MTEVTHATSFLTLSMSDLGGCTTTTRGGNPMNNILAAFCALQARFVAATDEERGATATEYALLLSFIALVIIVAVTLLGGKISGLFNTAASSIS